MDVKGLKGLITFHRNGLQEYGQFMSPSAKYLEEATIEILEKELRREQEKELQSDRPSG